jgi:pyruvate dehydrogenase E2 component (dihydrolipoamide acetyltransferase)
VGDFLMPSLGADMERGTLTEWMVKPGDYVHRGDIVAAVDTDKAVMDIETFEEGVVAELLVAVGENVPVGTVLARIGTDSPKPKPKPKPKPQPSPPVRHLAHELGVDPSTVHGSGTGGTVTRHDVEAAATPSPVLASAPDRVRSSPRARVLASELHLQLSDIAGTGPAGAVTAADVRAAGAAPITSAPVTSLPDAPKRSAGLRRAIGTLMTRSKKSIPHYYLASTIDLKPCLDWMRVQNAQRTVANRLVPAALLLKATALAARQVPEMNGFFTDGAFRPSETVDLGVAVALRSGGLVAPAILAADTLELDLLMQRMRDLVARARSGHVQRAEMAAPTVTVTNLGELGADSVFGVIYPPQVALVGFGRILEQPWAVGGLLGVHPVVTVTLSADHRVSDGLGGSRFLRLIAELLEKPEEL